MMLHREGNGPSGSPPERARQGKTACQDEPGPSGKLQGVIPPLVTPLADDGRLDRDGLGRLVEHVIAGGVPGVFVLGTTGEAPSLSYAIRREVVARVCDQVAGRVAVLVGITDTAMAESLDLAAHAADRGADAVVFSTPYYFPAGQQELLDYARTLVAKLPLPAFLYNIPQCTKLVFGPEVVRQLMDLPGVVGLKDSSGDMVYFDEMLALARRRDDWSLLMGQEELMAEAVLQGADGGVCGGANLDPRLYVDLCEAARRHDLAQIDALQARLARLGETVFSVCQGSCAFMRSLKSALACLGICGDRMAPPLARLTPAQRDLARRHLVGLGYHLARGEIGD